MVQWWSYELAGLTVPVADLEGTGYLLSVKPTFSLPPSQMASSGQTAKQGFILNTNIIYTIIFTNLKSIFSFGKME